ncbi:hypothetical protein ACFY2R_20345 [Micromonospora olivasterospora]|uniref:Uncharacterized protein n=1 Tax=Micromonospora olivasterospora TaxID=1880 RepID=A0A562II14_MICOL|nr:hypothetical protein [Micromonospora olivasterospora]TWH70649.1 hypothetical protein JD77_05674 [Micromonospora olivasterospora]
MTNTATFEDALASILGLVLGGGDDGDGGSINNDYRPKTIQGPGYWLITQISSHKELGGYMPDYDKDAVTFYRWRQDGAIKHVTRLTVWVGVTNNKNAQGQTRNTTDPTKVINGGDNQVVALGNAWERMAYDLPKVAGPGKAFDPNSIGSVREILGNLTTHAMGISGSLTDQIKSVNVKNPDFKGSAEMAWIRRVQNANKYLVDVNPQFKIWDTALSQVEQAMKDFIVAVEDTFDRWTQIHPGGVWQHPYRVIARMFNESTLQYGDLHDGQSNAWDLGQQYANTKERTTAESQKMGKPKDMTVLWTPPEWVEYHPFDAFSVEQWNGLDRHLRQMWAKNAIETFKPALVAADKLKSVFVDARNPISITDPKPPAPFPMPNDVGGMPNGGFANDPFGNMGNPFANWGDPFANMGNPFANMGNPFANMGNPFANMGNPFANVGGMGNPFPNGGGFGAAVGGGAGNPFTNSGGLGSFAAGGAGNPFPNELKSGMTVQAPFANDGLGNPSGGGGGVNLDPRSLITKSVKPDAGGGAGNPFVNGDGFGTSFGGGGGGGGGGGAGNPFVNGDGLGTSFAGLGGGGGGGGGGGAGNPFVNGDGFGTSFGGGAGGGGGGGASNPFTGGPGSLFPSNGAQANNKLPGPQSLGDLTPAQLKQLDSAGLLNNVPLTPEQAAFLKKKGMAAPNGATRLGQLNPDQLDALQKGGLLDRTPITDGQRAHLGLPEPHSLGDLTPAQLKQLDSAGLLNKVPLTPEQAAFLREHGLAAPNGAKTLGQLNPDQLGALQKGGLLDRIPINDAQRSNLGLPEPSRQSGGGGGGVGSVPGLKDPGNLPWPDTGPTPPVDKNQFPTTVDGKNVSPKPGMSGNLTPPPLGDVTKPGSAAFPKMPGVQVGTGGLSSVPGIPGSPGALNHDKLGVPLGGPGPTPGAGMATGAGAGVPAPQPGSGGMPFMPPMMPGMPGGGQPGKDRDRQRSTWLKEDEKVWGTDPDCAPAVIGRRGRGARVEDDEFDTPDERPGVQDERRRYRGR